MTDIQRLLPQAPDAEQGVLASILLSPNEVGGFCAKKGVTPAYFHIPAHAHLYSEMRDMMDEAKQIDLITLTQRLRDKGLLDQCGGPAFVSGICMLLPTAANAAHYVEIIREKFILREVIKRNTELASESYAPEAQAEEAVRMMQRHAAEIAEVWKTKATRKTNAQVISEILHDFSAGNPEQLFGRSTGFPMIDEEIGGLLPGDLMTIAGGPSSGKSALALQIEYHWAKTCGERVVDFTFEMTQRQKLHRLIQLRAQLNMREAYHRSPELGQDPFAKLGRAGGEAASVNIEFLDDRSQYQNIRGCYTEALRLHAQSRIGLVILDFDELIPGIRQKGGTKEEELASIAYGWKALAGELKCPAILLSQVTDNDGKANMRGSASKLQAANVALYIAAGDDEQTRNIVIWKARDGRRGAKIRIGFDGKTTRFYEVAQDEPDPPTKAKTSARK